MAGRPGLRGRLLVAALFGLAKGDGPVATTTSTTTTTTAAGFQMGCNPYDGYQYFRITLAGPIPRTHCTSSWDLNEVEMWDVLGNKVILSADAPYGSAEPASNAVDGDLGSYFAGDHDIGAGCTCWDDSKVGSSGIVVNTPFVSQISRIKLTQGGDTNPWSVARMKIECGSSPSAYSALPIFVDTSRTSTTITCSPAGCTVERETPLTDWCEGVALAGLGSTLSVALLVSQMLHWLSI
ncbi:Gstt1 [Symbiodinium sp. KB8]|nr:Gstt1 [Symbiodinium sp. KB8]